MNNIIPLPVPIRNITIKKPPDFEVIYPSVELTNKVIENKINQIIINNVNKLIAEQGYASNPNMQIKGSYEIKTNERNILSLILLSYSYAGGAHGYTLIEPLTFDVKTGNVIPFDKLFIEGTPYYEELSEIIKKQIESRQMPILGGFNRLPPDPDFYIADKSLVIFFQLYELAPYAQGFPAFPISLYEIKNLIGEDSILRRMMTFY
ncbi:MAG: DUF3298 and DUF4163 domain-containing protein [Clostridiales bacterium]|nr:DUF3298 and DUF4163 domain-containing protein [Clostridiales bacterium]